MAEQTPWEQRLQKLDSLDQVIADVVELRSAIDRPWQRSVLTRALRQLRRLRNAEQLLERNTL